MAKSPIPIYGGKHYMLKYLLDLIPPHKRYVEVFGGTAKLLFAKEPSPTEVYNDIDSNLVTFFKVLREDSLFEEFYKLCICTPYSREVFYECRTKIKTETDEVRRAWQFFVCARQCFSGRHKSPSWSRCSKLSRRNMAMVNSAWIGSIEALHDVHTRLMRVLIEHQDFRKLILHDDSEETFFYLDPPYVQSVRHGKDTYNHEMNDKDHQDLIDILLKVKGKVVLSGYNSEIYKNLEDHGWKRTDYDRSSWASSGKPNRVVGRVESIWLSPNCDV